MSFFVTGTDTAAGKTFISCALLHAYAAQGQRVVGMKPVAAGRDADGQNDDVKALQAASNVEADAALRNPFCFASAIAPHLAAQQERVTIDLVRIAVSFTALKELADVVIVEGAGGFVVPLNDDEDSADLAVRLGLPVVLVVGMRLGCLNHSLLTVQAIAARGLTLAGWVANCVDEHMAMRDENIAALRQRISAPLLGIVPYQARPDARLVAAHLKLAGLNNPNN
jgi:dethiobiotin synthetase